MTCDHGWTLVARFSNSDTLHWMKDSGLWWYDKNVASGETLPEIRVISFIMRYFYSWPLYRKSTKHARWDQIAKTKWPIHQADVSG